MKYICESIRAYYFIRSALRVQEKTTDGVEHSFMHGKSDLKVRMHQGSL